MHSRNATPHNLTPQQTQSLRVLDNIMDWSLRALSAIEIPAAPFAETVKAIAPLIQIRSDVESLQQVLTESQDRIVGSHLRNYGSTISPEDARNMAYAQLFSRMESSELFTPHWVVTALALAEAMPGSVGIPISTALFLDVLQEAEPSQFINYREKYKALVIDIRRHFDTIANLTSTRPENNCDSRTTDD
jgi:Arc/MetJ family transcription regulator